jgi:hypothetical protein
MRGTVAMDSAARDPASSHPKNREANREVDREPEREAEGNRFAHRE